MSKTSIKRSDGKERSILGYMFDSNKLKGKKQAESRYQENELPKKVDLRPHMSPIEQQGGTYSCVANAVAGAYEYLAKWHTGEDYDVSRLFIYYNGRALAGMENQDGGCYIADAIEGLKQYGACAESTWEFDEEIVNDEPSEEAYEEASNFLVEDMQLVATDLNAWKSTLAEGYPIIFGLSLYDSFDQHRKKGYVDPPSKNEVSRAEHSGHAMLCVGYSDRDQVFIVRNSWGEDWGDNGYCYIPYNYIINEQYNDGDSWVIKQLDNIEFGEEQWADDDDSVLSEYDSEIANMTEEEYQEMQDAMGDYPLEYRLTFLFLWGASADDDMADEEWEQIASYLANTLEVLGLDLDAEGLMEEMWEEINNEDILNESIELIGEYLSPEALANIINDIEAISDTDEVSEEEQNFIDYLVEQWQIDYHEDSDEDE
ncbi:MAG: peptidase C1 [Cytophagales bacterium]|nr:MAG: peptidase C1 [Cytophagales bacterium]